MTSEAGPSLLTPSPCAGIVVDSIGILIGLIIGWGLSFCYWHQSKPSSKKASSMAYGGY